LIDVKTFRGSKSTNYRYNFTQRDRALVFKIAYEDESVQNGKKNVSIEYVMFS
jgi:hypothetical protein